MEAVGGVYREKRKASYEIMYMIVKIAKFELFIVD